MNLHFLYLISICTMALSCDQHKKEASNANESKTMEREPTVLVYGIDISHHQDDEVDAIDKQRDGLDFIICKATEGVTYVDPKFSQNWKMSRRRSFIRGAYHFYRCEDDPIEQAAHFLETVSDLQPDDIPPIVDFEEGSIDKTQSIDEIQSALKQFLIEVEKGTKGKPIIYTDINTGNKYLSDASFADYALWVANYTAGETPDLPNAWKNKGWVFWQKSDNYVVDGTTDDFDRFNGNLSELKDFIKNSYK